MRWKDQVAPPILRDAVESLARHGIRLSAAEMRAMATRAKPRTLAVKRLYSAARDIRNGGRHRVEAVLRAKARGVDNFETLARLAYPRGDRPRKGRDLSSVVMHATSRRRFSPILILAVPPRLVARMTRFTHKKRGTRGRVYLLLDGVHRAVAAAASDSAVRVRILSLSALRQGK